MNCFSFALLVNLAAASLAAGADAPELIGPVADRPSAVPEEVAPGAVGFRIRLGMKDADPTDWSGEAAVSSGRVISIHGWRWAQGDKSKANTWTITTRRQSPLGGEVAEGKGPVLDSGLIITFGDVKGDSKIDIKTPNGSFSFTFNDVPYGKRVSALDGKAEIERVPAVVAGAQTNADEDYPAAALAKDGTTYVTYLSFYRGEDFQGVRERLSAFDMAPQTPAINPGRLKRIDKPEDLDYLREPTGGEVLYLRAFKDGKWGNPVPLTERPKGKFVELYRPALAVDGAGKVWVFYSAHFDADADLDYGNWDLLARSYDPAGGKLSDPINLSNTLGADFMPAATTDSAGKVWVAWVGSRGEHFNIFTSHQTDAAAFSAPERVTASESNEWEPAIAADKNGTVTVGWDTYEKGDYDVYVAKAAGGGKFSAPVPVAATLNFEVRPSLAYDSTGRLWVAWEQGGELWGKDFGALKKKGTPLYSGIRSLGVKVQDTSGQWYTPPDVMEAVGADARPGAGKARAAGNPAKQAPAGLGAAARARGGTAPCFPRLAADDQGRIWLAFRGRQGGNWRVGVGSVWFEFVTRLDGDDWLPAAWIPHSNNILDNRPALVAAPDHSLLVFFSGDGRGEILPARVPDPHTDASEPAGTASVPNDNNAAGKVVGAGGNQNSKGKGGGAGPDPNDDIYLAVVRPDDAAPAPARLDPAPETAPAKPGPDVDAERQAVKTARDFRVNLNGETLRIWRGEFHRHTELSPDGGGDGGLLDMWRYTIDAASLDWVGDGDHDYGNGREYSWWTTQKAVTLFTIPDHFTPMFCYERSVVYPEGHRNCMFGRRGLRSLPRLPLSSVDAGDKPAPDTNLLYMYLHHFDGVCAPHTSATDMGTDWRNNDPAVEPFVEIYQGDRNNYERPDAPRSAITEAKLKQSTPEAESFGGYRPKGFVNLALLKGYRLAFESSSDHISTHMSYTNVYVTEPTRQGILDAIKKRRVYGSTDNIVADVRVKTGNVEHFMGEEFSTPEAPTLNVHLIGALKLMNVTIIKDDEVVYSSAPNQQDVTFQWTDPKPEPGKTSYYYVRGEQVPDVEGATGELVWASPMWIKYSSTP